MPDRIEDLQRRIQELEAEIEDLQVYLIKEKEAQEYVKSILSESEERMRRLVASAPVLICALDRELKVTFLEDNDLRMLKVPKGKMLGLSIFDIYEGDKGFPERMKSVLSGESYETIVEMDGLTYEVRGSPIKGESGEVTGVIVVGTDITERIAAQRHLTEKEKLQGILEIAGAVSHELNQPLQVKMSSLEIYKMQADDSAAVEQLLQRVFTAIERIVKIEDSLTRLTQYETLEYTNQTRILDIFKAAGK